MAVKTKTLILHQKYQRLINNLTIGADYLFEPDWLVVLLSSTYGVVLPMV